MDEQLRDYRQYYRLKAERLAKYPSRHNSCDVMDKICKASLAHEDINSFQKDLMEKGLITDIAKALQKDKAESMKAVYDELEEKTRSACQKRILKEIEPVKDVSELTDTVNRVLKEENQKISIEVSAIEAFISLKHPLENYMKLTDSKADLGKYEHFREKAIDTVGEATAGIWREGIMKIMPSFNFDMARNEKRFRRLIPFSDKAIDQMEEKIREVLAKY